MASSSSGLGDTPSSEVLLTGPVLATERLADIPTRGGGGPTCGGGDSTRGGGDSDNGPSDGDVASLPSDAQTADELWNVDEGAADVLMEPGTDVQYDGVLADGEWEDDPPPPQSRAL